ncbi:MAG: thiolase family protein [Vulcanimicrobiaceae bacterium]
MKTVYIIDAVRTPIGRLGGVLSTFRPDDLAARVVRALVQRTKLDPMLLDDVIFGAANQAGEDNRNVARMAVLLAGLPVEIPGTTVNRLCGSSLDAIVHAARAIACGEARAMIAGGVESMTRAPYVLPKSEKPFDRQAQLYDTTLGWRMLNPAMPDAWTISLGATAENVARQYGISREDQDRFALVSQQKCADALREGRFRDEIVDVDAVAIDEHPRPTTTLETLAKLKPAFEANGTVTAGNSSGINDGAAAVLLCDEATVRELGLQPMARYVSSGVAGVDPSIMGIGPVPATQRALSAASLPLEAIDIVELNEAFAAQALASMRALGLSDARVNPNGGAIALGHPLGASGARLVTTLLHELRRQGKRYGLATMCIGVGQGIAGVFENLGTTL